MLHYLLFSALVYHAHTSPQEAPYHHLWLSTPRPSFDFYVRACSDVHVALSYWPGNTEVKTYEIVLGAEKNTYSVIVHYDDAGNRMEEARVSAFPFKFLSLFSPQHCVDQDFSNRTINK